MEHNQQAPITAGSYSKAKPDKKILADAAFGYYICKEIGRNDAGQTVVVKNNSIMAVEAFEGRLDTISRGCHFANGKAVIVISGKYSKSDESVNPLIDLSLLKYAVECGGKAIALEAEKVNVLNIKDCMNYASKSGLVFFVFNGTDLLKYMKKGS